MRRALAAGLALLVLAGCGAGDPGPAVTGITTSDNDGYHGILLDDPYAVPSIPLTDTYGKPFDLADQARRSVVFFGYTNCPDVCAVVMSTIASAVARLPEALQQQVQVVFVTTDPPRDTPQVLRTYLDRFDPSFIGVTGSIAQIDTLGKPMDIFVKKGQKLPTGGYEVDHSSVVVSVNDGAGDLVWTGGTSPAEISSDLTKILEG